MLAFSFWEEVERYREGQTIVFPLFGTGITRYKKARFKSTFLTNRISMPFLGAIGRLLSKQ
ncbi:macro domain-containing protein [Pseudogracilibacillus sp. SO30301A]|uniref:macro domain-containing protein n=1 Tax=Pseudogracilibacillus sp. SO30301A TaxID=3098291 RepID=UPI003FA7DF57